MMALVVLLDFVISQCVCACVSRRCEGKLMAWHWQEFWVPV